MPITDELRFRRLSRSSCKTEEESRGSEQNLERIRGGFARTLRRQKWAAPSDFPFSSRPRPATVRSQRSTVPTDSASQARQRSTVKKTPGVSPAFHSFSACA